MAKRKRKTYRRYYPRDPFFGGSGYLGPVLGTVLAVSVIQSLNK